MRSSMKSYVTSKEIRKNRQLCAIVTPYGIFKFDVLCKFEIMSVEAYINRAYISLHLYNQIAGWVGGLK